MCVCVCVCVCKLSYRPDTAIGKELLNDGMAVEELPCRADIGQSDGSERSQHS